MFSTSHKNKYKQCNRLSNYPSNYKGKQDGGYFYPKTEGGGGGGGGASTLVDNSANAEETFKIQIGISKINNFTFKGYIFYRKFIE